MIALDKAGMGVGSYPVPILPQLSSAERDRRWATVRALMARDGIDVVLTLSNSSWWDMANSYGRYLCPMGGNCAMLSIVFPGNGEVTALGGPTPKADFWLKSQNWVTDVRTSFFDMTSMVLDRVEELGLASGRIGIAGLTDVPRQPDGLVSSGALERIKSRFPEAKIVSATKLLAEARLVKSAEEIEMLRHSITLVEEAFDVMATEARPGVPECVVFGRMVGAMIEKGSEPTSMMLWSAGNPLPPTNAYMPSLRPLGTNDVILVECDAKWAGYNGQGTITHWVGEADDIDREMAELQYEAFLQCCNAMRPGTPFGSLVDVCANVVAGTPYVCKPIAHGRGHGMDGPVLVYEARDEQTKNWRIVENSTFIVKPNLSLPDGSRMIMWGDTVVVTPSGAKRLGKRLPPLISTSSSG